MYGINSAVSQLVNAKSFEISSASQLVSAKSFEISAASQLVSANSFEISKDSQLVIAKHFKISDDCTYRITLSGLVAVYFGVSIFLYVYGCLTTIVVYILPF